MESARILVNRVIYNINKIIQIFNRFSSYVKRPCSTRRKHNKWNSGNNLKKPSTTSIEINDDVNHRVDNNYCYGEIIRRFNQHPLQKGILSSICDNPEILKCPLRRPRSSSDEEISQN